MVIDLSGTGSVPVQRFVIGALFYSVVRRLTRGSGTKQKVPDHID